MDASANRAAFLAMIRASEGTAPAPDPYAVTFGKKFVIQDFSDHPHALGWPGYLWMGRYETASGAYQITYPTWTDVKAAANLPDFGRGSQDAAALWLIEHRAQALDLVDAGNAPEAIYRCSKLWASLPGSTSGQPQARFSWLIGVYGDAGGGFA